LIEPVTQPVYFNFETMTDTCQQLT